MRILHLHDAPHIGGGASGYIKQLFESAASRGHLQWAFSLDQEADHPALQGARAFRYAWPPSALRRRLDFHTWHRPLAEALEAWIQEVQPDLIHVQNCVPFRNTVFPALGRAGRPVVMTVHDFSLVDPNPAGLDRRGLGGTVRAWLDRRSLATSRREVFAAVDLFLCPTEALRDTIGFRAGQARLQRLPIALAEARPAPAGSPQQPLRIFFAGTLYRSKGVDVLLRALAAAGGAARSASLEIAGEGDRRSDLESLAAELGLRERVAFLGRCDAARMDAAYAACHILVLPSRVPENSPLTVLEAGARGRPSLAPATGGVPELLADARGWTFPSEDVAALARALESVAADPAEAVARGARMRAWVRAEFDPQRHWESVESAWREVVRSEPRR